MDVIDHPILLTKLRHSFGTCDLALSCFRSYLTDRKQTVSVNVYSDPSALRYGVPQGSVLGPVLIYLYGTPVSNIVYHQSLHHESFADDTQAHQSALIKLS